MQSVMEERSNDDEKAEEEQLDEEAPDNDV